ncbi:alpha/beta-hydrolase, partial [Ramicandelaber brevisporus]
HSIIARNDNLKQVIVGFRGSTDVSWTNNLDFAHHDWPVNVGFGTPGVHNGFFNGYAAGADDIYAAAVAQLTKYPTYQLVFAGYSLGGAHATIAAVDFQLRNPALAAKTKVFTYGSPRVGDTDFAAYYNSRGFLLSARTTAKKDMVVHLPPQWAGYTHVNREYWIDLSGNVKVCSAAGTGEDGSCQNSV